MPLGRSDRGHAIAQLVSEHSNVLRVVRRHRDEMDAARLECRFQRAEIFLVSRARTRA